MIYVHACDFCQSTRGRRAAQRVLFRLPNITSTKAALLADMERPSFTQTRLALEAHGCVPKRTTTGHSQRFVEQRYAGAKTSGGSPIASTPSFDFESVVQHFGLMAVISGPPRASGPGAPIGGLCYPGMSRAA